jgi:hypothetical protein
MKMYMLFVYAFENTFSANSKTSQRAKIAKPYDTGELKTSSKPELRARLCIPNVFNKLINWFKLYQSRGQLG